MRRIKCNGFTLIELMIVVFFIAAAFTFGITAPPTGNNSVKTITLNKHGPAMDYQLQPTAAANYTPDWQLQPAQFLPGQQQAAHGTSSAQMMSCTPNTLFVLYAVYDYSSANGEPPNYYLSAKNRANTAPMQGLNDQVATIGNTRPSDRHDRITKYYSHKENIGPTDGTSTIKPRPLNLRV